MFTLLLVPWNAQTCFTAQITTRFRFHTPASIIIDYDFHDFCHLRIDNKSILRGVLPYWRLPASSQSLTVRIQTSSQRWRILSACLHHFQLLAYIRDATRHHVIPPHCLSESKTDVLLHPHTLHLHSGSTVIVTDVILDHRIRTLRLCWRENLLGPPLLTYI